MASQPHARPSALWLWSSVEASGALRTGDLAEILRPLIAPTTLSH